MTEKQIREFFEEFPNKFGDIYTFSRKIDNEYMLSYHLKLSKENIQYNFWFEKLNYLNSTENIRISIFDGNVKFRKDELKTILKTDNFDKFKEMLDNIFEKHNIPKIYNPNNLKDPEYWKLTWEEYAQTVYISSGQKEAIQNAWAKVIKPTNKAAYNQLLSEWWEANNPHRKLVLKAYSEGKPVPTHILKFYKIMKNNILSGLQGFGFVPDLPSVIKVGDKVYSTNNTTIYTVGAAAWQTGAPIGTTPLTKITEAGKYIGKVKSIKGDVITLDYDKPRFVKYSEVQKEGTPGGAPNPNVPAPFGPGTTEPPKPEPDTSTGSGMKKYLPLALAAAAGLALYSMSSGGSGRRKKKRSGLFGTYHGRNGVKTIPVKIGNQTMKIHLKTTEVK